MIPSTQQDENHQGNHNSLDDTWCSRLQNGEIYSTGVTGFFVPPGFQALLSCKAVFVCCLRSKFMLEKHVVRDLSMLLQMIISFSILTPVFVFRCYGVCWTVTSVTRSVYCRVAICWWILKWKGICHGRCSPAEIAWRDWWKDGNSVNRFVLPMEIQTGNLGDAEEE
jgi:hypothetical protein